MKTVLIHPTHAKNRLLAVQRMLASLPPIHTEAEAIAQANVLAGFTSPQRACWAEQCQVKSSPSDDTWELLVEMAREREPVSVLEVRLIAAARGLS